MSVCKKFLSSSVDIAVSYDGGDKKTSLSHVQLSLSAGSGYGLFSVELPSGG